MVPQNPHHRSLAAVLAACRKPNSSRCSAWFGYGGSSRTNTRRRGYRAVVGNGGRGMLMRANPLNAEESAQHLRLFADIGECYREVMREATLEHKLVEPLIVR